MALVLTLGPATAHGADPDAAAGLKLKRVVLLMRHGIRPPTKAAVTPPGIAAAPWPKWEAPYGHLTAHGAEAIRLELLADRAGARYVQVFYRSQTLQQMRELTRLGAAHPAFRQALAIPGCAMRGDTTRCPLDTFAQVVRGKLIPGE